MYMKIVWPNKRSIIQSIVSYTQFLCIMSSIFVMTFTHCACEKELRYEVKKIYINEITVYAEVADEPHKRRQGLKQRKELLYNWGMLFVYDEEKPLEFWMKDTELSLDIAFIDEKGVITEIIHMDPFDRTIHRSKKRVQYALEISKNWFKRNKVKVGDVVEGLTDK